MGQNQSQSDMKSGKVDSKWGLSLKVAICKVLYMEKTNKSDIIGGKSDEIDLKST